MAVTDMKDTDKGINWSFWVVLTFLIGLLFFSYPPLKILSNSTSMMPDRLFRPDWGLSIPLLVYFMITQRKVRLTRPILLAFLFVFMAAVSFFINPARSYFDFLTLFIQLVFAVGIFTVLANMNLDRETFRTLLQAWIVILALVAVYTMYEIVAINLDLPFSKLYDRRLREFPSLANRYHRPVAIFSEPGFLSSLLATGIAALLPPVATGRHLLFSKWVQRAFLVLITAGVLASFALSGYLTIALSLVVIILLPSLRGPIFRFCLLAIILVIGGLLGLSYIAPGITNDMIQRIDTAIMIFSSLADGEVIALSGSIGTRWIRFMSGLEALAANPLFGVGPGQFSQWVENAALRNLPSDPRYGRLHGGYIQIIAETGIAGTLIFIALFVGVIRKLRHSTATMEGDDHTLALICTCMVIFMLVGWSHSFGMIHTVRWGLIGMCYGYVTTGGG